MIQDHDLFIRKFLISQLYNGLRDTDGTTRLCPIMDDQAVIPFVRPDYGGAWVRVITDPNSVLEQTVNVAEVKNYATYPILVQTKCGDGDLTRVVNTIMPLEQQILAPALRVGTQMTIYPLINSLTSTQDVDQDGNALDPAAYTFVLNLSVTVVSTIASATQPAKVVPFFTTDALSPRDATERDTWLASLIGSGAPYYSVARVLESNDQYDFWQAIPSVLGQKATFQQMVINAVITGP